jgi:hypothetical protein
VGLVALAACRPPPPAPLPEPVEPKAPPPDREVAAVTDLLTSVGLEWALILDPPRLLAKPWLRAALSRVLDDERLDALAVTTSVDVTRARELVLCGYENDVTAFFVRHPAEIELVERRFRDRLPRKMKRREWDHQLVTVWGTIGHTHHGYVAVGPDVSGFQYGGDQKRGPMTIAALYALDKLDGVPTVLADPLLARLVDGSTAPATFLMPGPFIGEAARGARGLFGAAEGVAVTLALGDDESVKVSVLLAGDYTDDDPSRPLAFLERAWNDLASSDLGHLLGLHEPTSPPRASSMPIGLRLDVALRPGPLAAGLAAATMDDARDFLR